MILNKKHMESNTTSTTENNSLMLKMVSSYSIFLLIILVLFGILCYSSLHNMCDLYNFQNKASMSRDVELFEQDLNIMEMYCRQLLQNSSFRSIMNLKEASDLFYNNGSEVKTSLAIDIYPETLLPLDEVYVYLPLTDYILSPGQFCTSDFFYEKVRVYPEGEYENWLSCLCSQDNYYRFLSMRNLTPHSNKTNYLYILDLGDLYYTDVNAVVCFVIDGEKLLDRFHIQSSERDSTFLSIYDENGSPVFTLLENDSFPDLDFPSDENHFSSCRIDDTSITVGKYVSPKTGYSYYYSFPSFNSASSQFSQLMVYLVLMILALITGGALIFVFSRRNVAPIVELGAELQVMAEEKSMLQEVVDKQKPIIRKSYIHQLFSGAISSEDEMRYIEDYLQLSGGNTAYNVVYVVAYNNSENAGEAVSGSASFLNPEDFEAVMLTNLQAGFGEPFYYYSPSDRTYAILLSCNASESDGLVMKVQEIVVRLHESLLNTYGIWMFAGIGHTTDSLMNVWEAYQQAVEAVNYTTKNYIFFPYEFIKKDSNAFYYPPELSTKLIHFITTGNKPQVLELFGLLHQENIEERSLPVKLLQFLMQDIRNTLLKARFALPTGTDHESIVALDERFNEHLSFKLCEDIAMQLCELFQNGTEDTNLAASIEKYILQNYKDPSLCLNKISDEFQISESYFSHMFKEKTGVNFSVYLENIRMSEAARLIRDTDINLSELYIEVGYNNPATFRRAFKKTYGVTPSSMRDSASTK